MPVRFVRALPMRIGFAVRFNQKISFVKLYKSNVIPYVETVVSLSHKNADSHIHVNIEFGEGDGKIPVDKIARKAEDYRPSQRVTYKMIQEYIESKYDVKVHTAYIAEEKRSL